MSAALSIAEKIANNSPTAVQSVKQSIQMGQGEPVEQAVAIMMNQHWRSVVHSDRVQGILALTEGREPISGSRLLISNRAAKPVL